MRMKRWNILKYIGLGSLVFGLLSILSGCVRFQAETWYKGADDPEPKKKEIVFDSRDYLPGQAPGSIELAE